jgi:hypothetical protein
MYLECVKPSTVRGWNESLAGSQSPLASLIHVTLKVGPTYYNLPEDEKLHSMKAGEADVGPVVA